MQLKTSEQGTGGTGGTGLRGVLEKQVKEHGQSRQSIWKGAQSATDEILSAPAFSAKQTSEVRKVPSPQQEPAQAFHLEPDEATLGAGGRGAGGIGIRRRRDTLKSSRETRPTLTWS